MVILPYTDTSSTTLVASGVAEFGVFSSISFYTNRAAGADLVATFAVVQHETGRLVFNADRTDIETPADLDGMTYAGFGTNWEEALISAIIEEAGGEGRFETVTLGTSAYEALANGRVDFTLEVSTWEGRQRRARRPAAASLPLRRLRRPRPAHDADRHPPGVARGEPRDRPGLPRGHPAAATASPPRTPRRPADVLIEATEGDAVEPRAHPRLDAGPRRGRLPQGRGRHRRHHRPPPRSEAIGVFLHEAGVLRGQNGEVLDEKPDFSTWFTNALSRELSQRRGEDPSFGSLKTNHPRPKPWGQLETILFTVHAEVASSLK